MFRTVPLQDQDGTTVPPWSCPQAVSKPLWHMPLLCVQWKTPDDGQRNCPKHVEFFSKIKFEKLERLVGFIIRLNIVNRPMAGRLRSLFRFPTQAVGLSLLQTVQAEIAVHVTTYAMRLVSDYPREWNGRCLKPATHFNLVPKSRMRGLILLRNHMPKTQRKFYYYYYYYLAGCTMFPHLPAPIWQRTFMNAH